MTTLSVDDYRRMSRGEVAFWAQLQSLPGDWVREFRFAPPRRWRFDFALPALQLAVEIDGGSGSHAHGAAWTRAKDYEKRNLAVVHNWHILVGTTAMAENGTLLAAVKEYLDSHLLR